MHFLNFIIFLKGVISCKIHDKNNRDLEKCLQANHVLFLLELNHMVVGCE